MGGAPAQVARAGDAAAIGLTGPDPAAVSVGSVLCLPEWPVPLVTRMEVRLRTLDIRRPLLRGARLVMHAHAIQETVVLTDILSRLDAKTGEAEAAAPRLLTRNQTALVTVTADRPVPLERYADYRALGRLALRAGGRTVAVGIVTGF